MVPEFETFQEDLRKSLKEKGYHIETWEPMQMRGNHWRTYRTLSYGAGNFEKM